MWDTDEVNEQPQNLFVAGFMGSPSMSFMRGGLPRCSGESRFAFEGTSYRVPQEAARKLEEHGAKEIVVRVRPESVKASLEGAV